MQQRSLLLAASLRPRARPVAIPAYRRSVILLLLVAAAASVAALLGAGIPHLLSLDTDSKSEGNEPLHSIPVPAASQGSSTSIPPTRPPPPVSLQQQQQQQGSVDAGTDDSLSFFCHSSSDQRCLRMFEGRSTVLSTYYAGGAAFYHNREAPSLDWIVVFVLSFFDVMEQERLSSANVNRSAPSSGERLVLFADEGTAWALVDKLERIRHNHRGGGGGGDGRDDATLQKQWMKEGWLTFVVLPSAEDIARQRPPSPHPDHANYTLRGGASAVPVVYLKRLPLWMSPPLVSSEGIPNAANNFRFGVYQLWLRAWRSLALQQSRRRVAKSRERRRDDKEVEGEEAAEVAAARTRLRMGRFMLSDSTDVVFQQNPFDPAHCFPQDRSAEVAPDLLANPSSSQEENVWVPSAIVNESRRVYFTLEASSKTFRNEKYNRRWISCYPKHVLREMHQKWRPVSCAGVTFGSALGLITYTTKQLVELQKPTIVQCSKDVIRAALDQGTHNFLLHEALSARERAASSSSSGGEGNNGGRGTDGGDTKKDHAPPRREDAESWEVHALHHEQNPCTFHGNFGTLRVAKKRASEVGVEQQRHGHGKGKNEGEAEYVVNSKGAVYAVIHQYTSNRHPEVMAWMRRRYL